MEVTYVINPSLFFVRKIATKSKFLQLEKDLTAYGNDEQNLETSINIKQGMIARTMTLFAIVFLSVFISVYHFTDHMCIVKQWKVSNWFRGHVKAVNTTDDGETSYNVTYIDYGYEECNIEASRVREIPECFRALSPQAIRCSLHSVMPKNIYWSNASTNDFLKLTNGA